MIDSVNKMADIAFHVNVTNLSHQNEVNSEIHYTKNDRMLNIGNQCEGGGDVVST